MTFRAFPSRSSLPPSLPHLSLARLGVRVGVEGEAVERGEEKEKEARREGGRAGGREGDSIELLEDKA
jgi:hypothetical protein